MRMRLCGGTSAMYLNAAKSSRRRWDTFFIAEAINGESRQVEVKVEVEATARHAAAPPSSRRPCSRWVEASRGDGSVFRLQNGVFQKQKGSLARGHVDPAPVPVSLHLSRRHVPLLCFVSITTSS